MAPTRLGPEIVNGPILLLDGIGVRAGTAKRRVALNLAIGLVARVGTASAFGSRLDSRGPRWASDGTSWPACSPGCDPG